MQIKPLYFLLETIINKMWNQSGMLQLSCHQQWSRISILLQLLNFGIEHLLLLESDNFLFWIEKKVFICLDLFKSNNFTLNKIGILHKGFFLKIIIVLGIFHKQTKKVIKWFLNLQNHCHISQMKAILFKLVKWEMTQKNKDQIILHQV